MQSFWKIGNLVTSNSQQFFKKISLTPGFYSLVFFNFNSKSSGCSGGIALPRLVVVSGLNSPRGIILMLTCSVLQRGANTKPISPTESPCQRQILPPRPYKVKSVSTLTPSPVLISPSLSIHPTPSLFSSPSGPPYRILMSSFSIPLCPINIQSIQQQHCDQWRVGVDRRHHGKDGRSSSNKHLQ